MLTYLFMAIGIAVGYTVAVGLSMLGTFAITLSLPKFVAVDNRLRTPYKISHELLWLVCATAGAYTTAAIARDARPMISVLLLVAALIWVLWENNWEAKQRGIAHQILITIFTLVGGGAGYLLSLMFV